MENRLWGGRALLAVAAATVFIFLIHPVHADPQVMGPFGLNSFTHGFALVMVPLVGFGTFAFAEWLGLDRPLVRLALWCNLLATVLMAIAPLVSGWVTGQGFAMGHEFGDLAVALNRALARGYVTLGAAAMLLNGLATDRDRPLLRWTGLIAGTLPLLWLASGTFAANVHAMLILALLQGSWFVLAGRALTGSARDA